MTNSVYMPVKCVWGRNCVKENGGDLVMGKRCLIVTGKNGAKVSGALDDVKAALTKRDWEDQSPGIPIAPSPRLYLVKSSS